MIATAASRQNYEYLLPQIQAFFPLEASEFRRLYGANPSPTYRREGLASMTDSEISELAAALQLAAQGRASAIDALWGAVIEQGRRMSKGHVQ
jgi:hypothetical protein